jgi:hypothetical protein
MALSSRLKSCDHRRKRNAAATPSSRSTAPFGPQPTQPAIAQKCSQPRTHQRQRRRLRCHDGGWRHRRGLRRETTANKHSTNESYASFHVVLSGYRPIIVALGRRCIRIAMRSGTSTLGPFGHALIQTAERDLAANRESECGPRPDRHRAEARTQVRFLVEGLRSIDESRAPIRRPHQEGLIAAHGTSTAAIRQG